MKKTVLYIFIFSLCISCKNALNIKPQNIIQDEAIFSSESGIEAYMASLYQQAPLEDFNFWTLRGTAPNTQVGEQIAHYTEEAINVSGYDPVNIGDGRNLPQWNYVQIRNINNFIEKLPASNLEAAKKNNWLGEAKFLRAYHYFEMVKRYGGVPLITIPQLFTGSNIEELSVARNTEKEIYDFIAKELDEAALLLSETSVRGRVNKYGVYALKSRAMLFAGSIAKYGTMQLNGTLGIPAGDADIYWQLAYDAAKKVIGYGKYSLYRKNENKTLNFQALFLDQTIANTEAIFVRIFKYPERGHSYDQYNIPWGVRGGSGYSGSLNPTLELVEEFEYIEGSPGKLKLTDGSGNPIKYNNAIDLYANKDPRFAATIIYPFSDWKGTVIDVQAGLIDGTSTITTTNYAELYDVVSKIKGNKGIRIIGLNGISGGTQISQTGYYVRKYMDPVYTPSELIPGRQDQDWIDMRYGEVLLNYAEAAIELNKVSDAKTAINDIRDRAGIKLLTDAEVTRDKIRHERQIELAFEKHRYWDIRRWRIGESLMNATRYSAILPFKVLDDNTWIFKTAKAGNPKTFLNRFNYEWIDQAHLTVNPKLIQNPGY
ncbi:MAG TPA: RagB/SusD family nutrient uptake outer membrane protein [Pedobacter sp.]|uniref:RagB/SusD family nutrient uptake outer membrane protein n=1 Tax=Pedobacter sp. TaxID=1411316 RepID=UPI002C11E9AF|nr:RagB/SusD family nutrient uptake outer membrane protein [Pedobacter sp.]HMI03038.1 RagB/SusD family nutrient uptake outer membrane protein [Pedobacter sp.]